MKTMDGEVVVVKEGVQAGGSLQMNTRGLLSKPIPPVTSAPNDVPIGT